jgi:AmiR/NasT family two-component response regulator
MPDLPRLRVLITDERADVLERLAGLVRDAGHEPVACEAGVSDAAKAVERERPDVAIVGVEENVGHALELLDALSSAGGVPVVVALEDVDEQFIAEAAERDVFANAAPMDRDTLITALRLAHSRALQLRGALADRVRQLEERMQRRAIVERAKGVLMERHDLSEPAAYEMLRRHARNERQPLTTVADAVLRARRLLPDRRESHDAAS